MRRGYDALDVVVVGIIVIAATLLALILGWVAFCFASGGFTTTERERIGGVVCVITRDRLTGDVTDTACPVVKK